MCVCVRVCVGGWGVCVQFIAVVPMEALFCRRASLMAKPGDIIILVNKTLSIVLCSLSVFIPSNSLSCMVCLKLQIITFTM